MLLEGIFIAPKPKIPTVSPGSSPLYIYGISHGVRSTESGNEFPTGSRCDLVIPTINSLKRSDSRFSRVTYSSGATPETAVERIYDTAHVMRLNVRGSTAVVQN